MQYEQLLAVLHSEVSLISEIWTFINTKFHEKEIMIMKTAIHERKTYTLRVYNYATGCYETVEVTEEVYRAYQRTEWNINDNDDSFYAHEIQFSSLIGGSENAFQNFREFIDTDHTPDILIEEKILHENLRKAIASLTESERALIHALYFEGLSATEYAQHCGVTQQAISKMRFRILKRIKNTLN